jgi:hypothetical protein
MHNWQPLEKGSAPWSWLAGWLAGQFVSHNNIHIFLLIGLLLLLEYHALF